MTRHALVFVLLCCASAASAQHAPVPEELSASAYVTLHMGGDEPEEEIDWVFVVGSGGYIAGAAGGVYLSYLLVPSDSTLDGQLPLRIAAGVAGGTLISATSVYVANGFRGNLPFMIGGALAGQAIGVGVAGAFVLLDAAVSTVFGSNEPGLSWLGMAVILGTPFYASLGASYAADLGSAP